MIFKSVKCAAFKIFVLALPLILLFASQSVAQANPAAAVIKKAGSGSGKGDTQIPEGLTPQEVDAFLASLSDEEARRLLARKLKHDATEVKTASDQEKPSKKAGHHFDFFYKLENDLAVAKKEIVSSFSDKAAGSTSWADALNKLTNGKGSSHLLLMLLVAFLIIAGGFVAERLFLRSTEGLRQQILTAVPLAKLQRLGRFFSRMVLDALGVALYMLTTFILFVLVYDMGQTGHDFVSKILFITYYFRVIIFTARMILSPASAGLRLLPLEDDDARFMYSWFFKITFVLALFAAPGLIFRDVGGSARLFTQVYSMAGISMTLMLIIMVWQSRQRVAEAIRSPGADGAVPETSLRARFARSWHYFAILYVIGIGAYWTLNVFIYGRGEIIKLIASLFLVPIFIGLDQWVQRLLKVASGELPETIELSEDEEAQPDEDQPPQDSRMDFKHYVPVIKRIFRIVLLAFLFFLVLRLWGIDLPIGRLFTSHALNIIITLIVGFFIWEFIKARIDRKLKEEMPEDDTDMEEGGAGGSRSVTLLLLLRKFFLAVMFLIVTLTILSSLGVNIGPLIAGAGVVGLAIGFGAQTLVKDIIAGIFFLIDDAFRVGDFIETSGTKGMVEHISLRSLRLRSPRGPVHTIPFGSMGTVTNNSRDYIITKLDFRVRYDTDVEKVRKIIKRINKKIMKDEEMGPNLLDKVKSQGVRELDDSAMIMRVKFKTIPGEQFVIRREVYRLIQEAFAENGIEFAHRNVTVYMPPGEGNSATDEKAVEAGAAAALTAAQQQEDEKQKPKK